MSNCPQCNAELKPGAIFCHACGFKIEPVVEQPVQTQPIQQQTNQTTNLNQNTMENQNVNNGPTGPVQNGLFQRVINIITKPKQEFEVIANESPETGKILGYAIPLMLIPAIAQIIGYGLVGYRVSLGFLGSYTVKSWKWGIATGVTTFVGGLISIFLLALIIDLLAGSFNSEKNFGRSLQLVVYAWTPAWVAGIFYVIPSLGIIAGLAGIYGLVLLYFGIAPLKKTPADKITVYFIISLVVAIVVFFVVALIMGLIVTAIYNPLTMGGFSGGFSY